MADIDGYGTVLTVDNGVATTTIGGIVNISGPSIAGDAIDVADMDSTGKVREFIPGLIDGGEVTCTVNYNSDQGGAAYELHLLSISTTTAYTWTITFNDGGTNTDSSMKFPGFLSGLGASIPNGDKVTQDVTIKVGGKWTYTDLS